MTIKNEIRTLLSTLNLNESIALIESLGKELRRKNSIRISTMTLQQLIELDRPDLDNLKTNNNV
jgi:hypothetical protein